MIDPFDEQVRRLCTITGIGQRTAEVVIAEIGVDMSRFPTARHLASWAGLCPGHHESAGKRRSGKARKGDAALAQRPVRGGLVGGQDPRTATSPRSSAGSRDGWARRNEGKAIFAVAHTLIVIIWHVLANNVDYDELGGDYYDRRVDTTAQTRRTRRPARTTRPHRHPHPRRLTQSGFQPERGGPPRIERARRDSNPQPFDP